MAFVKTSGITLLQLQQLFNSKEDSVLKIFSSSKMDDAKVLEKLKAFVQSTLEKKFQKTLELIQKTGLTLEDVSQALKTKGDTVLQVLESYSKQNPQDTDDQITQKLQDYLT